MGNTNHQNKTQNKPPNKKTSRNKRKQIPKESCFFLRVNRIEEKNKMRAKVRLSLPPPPSPAHPCTVEITFEYYWSDWWFFKFNQIPLFGNTPIRVPLFVNVIFLLNLLLFLLLNLFFFFFFFFHNLGYIYLERYDLIYENNMRNQENHNQ